MTDAAAEQTASRDADTRRASAFIDNVLAFLHARTSDGGLLTGTVRDYAHALQRVANGWQIASEEPTDDELDAQTRRFAETADGLLEQTVVAYRQRFRTAIALYRDPSRIRQHRSRHRRRSRLVAAAPATPAAPVQPMIDFPFALNDGTLTRLRLPALGLACRDAERLCDYVRTLVVEEPTPTTTAGKQTP